jgi:hypothetical protein
VDKDGSGLKIVHKLLRGEALVLIADGKYG